MENADEISDAMREVVHAYEDGDENQWRGLWSARAGIISLGTDPREWWSGSDTIVSLHAAHTLERGRSDITVDRIESFQEGSVGWSVLSATAEWAGGINTTLRLTGIFHLERGEWKLVHLHRSFGILNEDFGVHLSTNLENIAEAVGRERTDLTKVTAPNGTVTILFTDIEGSTQLTERLGDRVWMKLLHEHNAVVREQSARHSGYEVKSQGDGFMLAFASSRDALRCAIGIQRALASREEGALRVRIGLHTGEAIKEADDFYGRAVVLAARIAAEARGSEILASSLVRELIEHSGDFRFEPPVEVELKGLAGLHRLSAVRWSDS
jgi:class 3 adenylate cyclase